MDMELYSIINTMISVVLGGGWFLHYRATKRKANGEAKQAEAEANKLAQEYYNKTLEDAKRTIDEVREERDRYKDDRNTLERENEEIRKKYNQLEEQLTQMAIDYKSDIAKLSRRIDVISPFLCGVAGCLHRKQINFSDEEIEEIEPKNEKNGNTKKG